MITRFKLGQQFESRANPKKFATVARVRDEDPHWAHLKIFNEDGRLLDEVDANAADFAQGWKPV